MLDHYLLLNNNFVDSFHVVKYFLELNYLDKIIYNYKVSKIAYIISFSPLFVNVSPNNVVFIYGLWYMVYLRLPNDQTNDFKYFHGCNFL